MERQYEYRIKYQHSHDRLTNYHYYLAETAEQALEFQEQAIEHHDWNITLLTIEKKCPWANKWLDESDILTSQQTSDE